MRDRQRGATAGLGLADIAYELLHGLDDRLDLTLQGFAALGPLGRSVRLLILAHNEET